MPLVEAEIVLRPGETLTSNLAGRLADACAEAMGEPPGRTWVRVRGLSPDAYAEDHGGPPEGVHPVFLTVVKARPPVAEELQREVAGLTQAIAEVCGRPPENVHILYEPKAAGRIAFGGEVVGGGAAES